MPRGVENLIILLDFTKSGSPPLSVTRDILYNFQAYFPER